MNLVIWNENGFLEKKCEKHFSLVALRTTFFTYRDPLGPGQSWLFRTSCLFFWLKIVELILYHPTLALFCYPTRQTHRFLFLLLSSICPAYIKLSRQSLHSTTSCILLLLVTFSFLFVLLSIQSNSSRTLLAFNMP